MTAVSVLLFDDAWIIFALNAYFVKLFLISLSMKWRNKWFNYFWVVTLQYIENTSTEYKVLSLKTTFPLLELYKMEI